MWPDKLIAAALDVRRPDATPAIAWVPLERRERFGPIADSQIQPASLDVRLGEDFILHPSGEKVGLDEFFSYVLKPGECLLANLVESFNMPDNVVARVEGKSTWARQFLTVHSAGFIDPGFRGDITLELKNDGHHNLNLVPGMAIAQVSFQWLAAPAMRPYGSKGLDSHYQDQRGATESCA